MVEILKSWKIGGLTYHKVTYYEPLVSKTLNVLFEVPSDCEDIFQELLQDLKKRED